MAFDYSSRDYATIKADLLTRAERVFPEWTDRDPSDFGMLLVDLWAYMGDVMHYYIDRAAGESFLSTATQRESVLALANLMDYVPRGRSSAQATITLSNDTTSNVTLPTFTKFLIVNGEAYTAYTTSDYVLNASTSTTIIVTEGTLYEDEVATSSASGRAGQTYTLSNPGVDVNSLIVSVYEDGTNPTVYRKVSRIVDAFTGDRAFVAEVTADDYLTISFGNAVNGFIPPTGSKVYVTYSVSSGASGNLPANAVTSFEGVTPSGVNIVSSSAFTGGTDEEGLTSLKASIPSVISAQNRAVTKSDFIALATQVSGVSKAAVSYSPSLTGSSAGNASVTVFPHGAVSDYLTSAGTSYSVPATVQTAVTAYIQPLALLGVTVLCSPTVTWEKIKLTLTVVVNDRFVSNWVNADVSAAIDSLFSFENVFFGQRITLGQIYRAVLNVTGVEYCSISVFDLEAASGLQTSIAVDSLRLPKKGTVSITMSGGITTS